MVTISVDLRSAFVNANTILTNLKKQEVDGEMYGYKVLLHQRQYDELYGELIKDSSFLYFLDGNIQVVEK